MPALLTLLVLVLLETWGIVQVVHRFGGGVTLTWLLVAALAGAFLIRHGGLTAFRRIQIALSRGELPTADLFAGLMLAFAGALLLLPGAITDVIALSLLLGGGAMRKRLGEKLSAQMGAARPELKRPVTLEGDFQRKADDRLVK